MDFKKLWKQVQSKKHHIKLQLGDEQIVWLICLGISLAFWLGVKLDQSYTTQIQVRITWQVPDSLAWTHPPPKTMYVEVKGRGWDLLAQSLWRSDPVLFFPLNARNTPTVSRPEIIAQIEAQIHPGLSIQRLEHDYLPISLEAKRIKKVPIYLQLKDISFAKGYYLTDSIKAIPDSARVEGPFSIIDPILQWPTEPISLHNIDGFQQITVQLQSPFLPVLRISPQQVQVVIPAERYTEKVLHQPVVVLNDSNSIRIHPDHVRLSFELPMSHFDQVDTSDFLIVADLRKLTPGSKLTTTPLHLMKSPPLVRHVRFSPPAVSFYFVQAEKTENPQ